LAIRRFGFTIERFIWGTHLAQAPREGRQREGKDESDTRYQKWKEREE